MKIGQVIEHNNRNIFSKIMQKMRQETSFQTSFYLTKPLHEVKASGLQLSFNILRQSSPLHAIKTNCIKLLAIDPEICSILIVQKRVWKQFLQQILCLIYKEKCFSCYTLLTDQVSQSDCFYFLRYQSTCVLELYVKQVVTPQILKFSLSF